MSRGGDPYDKWDERFKLKFIEKWFELKLSEGSKSVFFNALENYRENSNLERFSSKEQLQKIFAFLPNKDFWKNEQADAYKNIASRREPNSISGALQPRENSQKNIWSLTSETMTLKFRL